MTAPELNVADRTELARLVRQLSVVFGRVTLSSGREADYYVDLRRATLHHQAAPLIGRLMRELTADWDYVAVGGLTNFTGSELAIRSDSHWEETNLKLMVS